MKFKYSILFGTWFFSVVSQAATLELEIKNNCSGGFVAHVACTGAEFKMVPMPYETTKTITIQKIKVANNCIVNNFWDAIGFGAIFARNAIIKFPGKDTEGEFKATVIFKNNGFLNVCSPVITELYAEKINAFLNTPSF